MKLEHEMLKKQQDSQQEEYKKAKRQRLEDN